MRSRIVNLNFLSQKVNTSFHKFEDRPINCVLASTVVFKKTPKYQCQFLCLYLFDCCRACNAKYSKCLNLVRYFYGGPEYCYRYRDDLRPDRPLNWFICTLYLAYNLYFETATKMNNCFGFYRV